MERRRRSRGAGSVQPAELAADAAPKAHLERGGRLARLGHLLAPLLVGWGALEEREHREERRVRVRVRGARLLLLPRARARSCSR